MVSVIVTVALWMLMVDSIMICGTYFKHHRAPPWGATSYMKDTHRIGSAVSICFWLVVLTILTNISQWAGLSHILWKRKNVPSHQSVFEYVSIKGIVEVKFAWNKTRWTPRRLGSQPGGQWSCKGLIKLHIFAGLHYIDISGRSPQWPCSWVSRWCVLTRQRLKVLTGRLVRTEFKYG